jgi:hypothetical protein
VRRFAEDTSVSVGRSRGEIDDLLRSWGCTALQWGDHFEEGRARLEFTWKRDGCTYLARFEVKLPDDKTLRGRARHATNGDFLPSKYEKLKANAGRQEHRVLLLWLKAAFNAVEAGLVDPATIFLPFLVGADGRTVADVALPRMRELLTGTADRLLQETNP